MLTIGYIGNGKSTNRYHLPFVMQRSDKITVKKIFARSLENDDWEKLPTVEYTDKLDELLNDDDIDMIVVCTMQNTHYHYAKMVLEHNKHCLVEKPFMENSLQAKGIFELAKKRGLIVQAYQNRRFDSDFLTVKKVIESGKLGEIFEIEMHFDYYRPEIPEASKHATIASSYLYGHGCHTLDQAISYFGKPDKIHYDVRQLLGPRKMNDYFDLDLYYGALKVSIKSSYHRIKERPSFVVYGRKGCFVKASKDRQEEHLKQFYLPDNPDFGVDLPEHYGILTYYSSAGELCEEKLVSEVGDYGRVYDAITNTIIYGKKKMITDEETLVQMEILETGFKGLVTVWPSA